MKYFEIILKLLFAAGALLAWLKWDMFVENFPVFFAICLILGIVLIFNKKQSYGYKLSEREIVMRRIEGVVLILFPIIIAITAGASFFFIQNSSLTTYKSVQCGYYLRYSTKEWQHIKNSSFDVDFLLQGGNEFDALYIDCGRSLARLARVKNINLGNLPTDIPDVMREIGLDTISKITFNGMEAYQGTTPRAIEADGGGDLEIWFEREGFFFRIGYLDHPPYDSSQQKILRTFITD